MAKFTAKPEPFVLQQYPTQQMALDEIKPYWRNPRRVPEEAVNALVASIKTYGYAQPIVVDSEKIIIVGHTRYAALRRLGVTEVSVMVVTNLSLERVKELRVIDNRSAEFSSWDFDALMNELSELDEPLLKSFFPEADPEQLLDGDRAAEKRQWDQEWRDVVTSTDLVCTSCFHTFTVEVTREAVMSGTLEAIKEKSE